VLAAGADRLDVRSLEHRQDRLPRHGAATLVDLGRISLLRYSEATLKDITSESVRGAESTAASTPLLFVDQRSNSDQYTLEVLDVVAVTRA
jgi:hypothetical protein